MKSNGHSCVFGHAQRDLDLLASSHFGLSSPPGDQASPPDLFQGIVDAFEQYAKTLVSRQMQGSFTRALLTCNAKLPAVVEEVITKYCVASDDLRVAEEFAEFVTGTIGKSKKKDGRDATQILMFAEDLKVRFSRHLSYWRSVLHDLDVRIDAVHVGDAFDPELHSPRHAITATDGEECNTIAEVHVQRFVWRDEYGLDQSRSAEVTIYSA